MPSAAHTLHTVVLWHTCRPAPSHLRQCPAGPGDGPGWVNLQPAQQYLLHHALGLQVPAEDEPDAKPVKTATRDDKWTLNLQAARQFHAREGHLNVPRKHVERLKRPERPTAEDGSTGPQTDGTESPQTGAAEPVEVKLGMFLDNTRRRATKLTTQRRNDLDQLGMRW